MSRPSKLSSKQQLLVVEYTDMVSVVARCFVQNRPHWQRSALMPELEGEGYLALCKAARTYSKARLPYPKAYFARAILNAMLKSVKRLTRTPGEKVGMDVAEQEMAFNEERDDLADAIAGMDERDKAMAICRFVRKQRIIDLADEFNLNIRSASLASQRLARQIAERLGIPAEQLGPGRVRPSRNTTRPSCQTGSSQASSHARASASTQSHGMSDPQCASAKRHGRSSAQTPGAQTATDDRARADANRKGGQTRKAARAVSGRQQSPSSAGRSKPAQTQRTKPTGGKKAARRG